MNSTIKSAIIRGKSIIFTFEGDRPDEIYDNVPKFLIDEHTKGGSTYNLYYRVQIDEILKNFNEDA